MPEISVVAGPASFDLSDKVARWLGVRLVAADVRMFPDGESKIKIGKIGKDCVIVQSTYPPTDTHLIQALMLAKKCADDGARDICAVIPYLGYARQDRAFLEGEVTSIALVARLLETTGVRHVITVDIHSQLAMSHFASIQNVSSIRLLADHATKMKLQRPIAVSPDAGGTDRVRQFAKLLKTDFFALKKSRDRNTGEVTVEQNLDVDVAGRDAILVDDMISSGVSIVKAAELLHEKGAARIYAMCAHALMISDAAEKIKSAGVHEIIATNSVPGGYAKVDLSPAIGEAINYRYGSA